MSRRWGVAGEDTTWNFNFEKPVQYPNYGFI